ncbi:hypothetical protein EPI10_031472 [Gossypium australe]|uniref:Uncharacterized protein n=1 Tax=Gossypium australe TaxID=47621 RepID=A0A5B6X1J4_9ROSI|nr:hypothetical protein EPI10_031472 [Gossypium australe]
MTKKVDRATEGLRLRDRVSPSRLRQNKLLMSWRRGFVKWKKECEAILHLTMKECFIFVEGFACLVMKSFYK